MPKGPKGEARPRDANQLAKHIVDIATGAQSEVASESTDDGKDRAAVELGRRGGEARAANLTKKRRAQIAKKAAAARWKR